jgi:hypothetical protein
MLTTIDIPAVLGLISFFSMLIAYLDIIASDQLKNDIAGYLNSDLRSHTSSHEETYYNYALAIRSFRSLFGNHALSLGFLIRSFMVTVFFLLAVGSVQFIFNDSYKHLIKSSFLSNSSIIDILFIVLIGTIISDFLCFGKTLFFVQLFSGRFGILGAFILAIADLSLSIIIFVFVTGFSTAIAMYVFDITRTKMIVADMTISSRLALNTALSFGLRDFRPPVGQDLSKVVVDVAVDDKYVDIKWTYRPSSDQYAWREQVQPSWNLSSVGTLSIQQDKLISNNLGDYIKPALGSCNNAEYDLRNTSVTRINMTATWNDINGQRLGLTANIPVTESYADVWFNFNRTFFLSDFDNIWGTASVFFLQQYVAMIQSFGTVNIDYLSIGDLYQSYLSEFCNWRQDIRWVFSGLFPVGNHMGSSIERYSIPVSTLPYVGLTATIFFHLLAFLTYSVRYVRRLGRLFLPNLPIFSAPKKTPFTIVALMGSLYLAALSLTYWLLTNLHDKIITSQQ